MDIKNIQKTLLASTVSAVKLKLTKILDRLYEQFYKHPLEISGLAKGEREYKKPLPPCRSPYFVNQRKLSSSEI